MGSQILESDDHQADKSRLGLLTPHPLQDEACGGHRDVQETQRRPHTRSLRD